MSRFSAWMEKNLQRANIPGSFPMFSGDGGITNSSGMALDLGSSQTKVVFQDHVVFHQPTCIALHRRNGEVVAIGQAAVELLGKTPKHIEVIFPIRRGKVQDIAGMQLFVQLCLQSILRQKLSTHTAINRVFRPPVTVAVPTETSNAEKEMLQKVFREVGFPRVSFVTQLEAAYHHLQKQKKVGRVFALVNIGAMTTEMAFFAQHQMVVYRSLAVGGDNFTRAALHEMQKQYHCQVGWQTAEKVKINVGLIAPSGVQKNKKMVVRGRDILTSLPTTVQVAAEDLTPVYQPFIDDILQSIADLFQDAAPEVMAEGLDQGVMLTGGGSLLAGLAPILEEGLRTPVHISPSALEDVVRGL
jgi:rod shape-determining protein MreB and related proteins